MRPAAALLACLPAVAAKVDADKITKLPGYAPGAPATDQYSGASDPSRPHHSGQPGPRGPAGGWAEFWG